MRTSNHRCLFRLLILLGVCSLGVFSAVAIPLSEYRDSIDHIIDDIQSMRAKGEDETDVDFENRFAGTIEAMRSEFPKNQPVELENATSNTDNVWFHNALDDLERAPFEQREAKLLSIANALASLKERVNDLASATKAPDNKATDKQKMESILARPEYVAGAKGPNALTRMIEDFLRWLRSLFPEPPPMEPGRANLVSSVIQVVIVLIALVIIAYVVRLLLKRVKFSRKTKDRKKAKEPRIVLGERLKPEDTATDLLAEAEALARRGDLRAAIRKGYIALLIELGDRNLISLAQYKTNRDYLRSVRNRPQLHSRLVGLTDSFERHWYGYAQTTPNDWQDFRAGYREALQTGN
ncbi:MAG TPA: DUF4129 domain-containing protein [Pyrinomonadaceae bacterium]|nr:DUF4129 domain-containing protein [Pyrinomonadaceae bacterium]